MFLVCASEPNKMSDYERDREIEPPRTEHEWSEMFAMTQSIIANQMATFAEIQRNQFSGLQNKFAEVQTKLIESREDQGHTANQQAEKFVESQEQTANQLADLTAQFTELINGISAQISQRVKAEVRRRGD